MSEERYFRPIDDPNEIPENLSDEERIAFLEKHGVSEEFLNNAEEVPGEERPPPRTKPINVRFDDFTLGRLKELAERRNVGYQTLLKDFVVERLYQEELREGMLSEFPTALPTASVGKMVQLPESDEVVEARPAKPRDWQSWAYSFVKENEELLEDPDIDSISLSRLAKDASDHLLEVSGEIKRVSTKKGFPAAQLRRMVKGYDRLEKLTKNALELYSSKFDESGQEMEELKRTQAKAENNVIPLRKRA